ncbi:fructose bisphosphate aldolase [Agaribacter marinus]|uniref:fructose-bisphosphate aldolase n=1 Tax=Agaribacter marinus TaxID=1431249 RepID=A0AA37T414_9ALTE|nr:fructose bisphosphate aldolase [Agaribacter marinus]GLR71095.1 class I fructose-bisphosphate aldolase [Agaribacter marinus]
MATEVQQAMLEKVKTNIGFIAALDQSGGSTPKALRLYGIDENQFSSDEEMFDLVHAMRTRIITCEAFDGDRVLGAILFENTLDREIEGKNSAVFLWENKHVVPFLKVDKGLESETDGVQLMKPIPGLDALLVKANKQNVFGTKMRSVIKSANPDGIKAIVEQQVSLGLQIMAAGLVPILEPEVDINSATKAKAEALLQDALLLALDQLSAEQEVMLKVTIPETANFYKALIAHPRVIKVVALSGGYSRDVANQKLTENTGMIASFSRALSEGLSAGMSDEDFNATLEYTIASIYKASST